MIYSLLRIFFKLSLRLYFKRVHVHGLENIPKNKTVILASNHPNAFMDAYVIGAFYSSKISTLVRSDVFINKAVNVILGLFNLIPVYRSQEGVRNLHKNEDSFDAAILRLRRGHAILIFSEGTSIMGKHLLPIKKGTARLALKAKEQLDKEVVILPVGINYTAFIKQRSEVMLNFGKPIEINTYLEQEEQSAVVVKKITDEIRLRLLEEINCIDKDKTFVTESVLTWFRNQLTHQNNHWVYFNKERFLRERRVINSVNELPEQERTNLSSSVENISLPDRSSLFTIHRRSKVLFYGQLLITLPLVLFGFIIYSATFGLADIICKAKVKEIEFFASIKLSIAMIAYLVFALLLLTCTHFKYSILILLLSSLSSFWYSYILDEWSTIASEKRSKIYNQKHTEEMTTFKRSVKTIF